MENHLFSLWEQISKKDEVIIAVDGSTYEYNDQELIILSDLKIFKQFEILYVTNREIENKDLNLKIHTPKILIAGKDEFETRLYEQNSENMRGSGFRGEKLIETLSTELIACLSIADFTVTKTKTSEIPYYINNRNSFYGKNPFSGTMSECMSALRVWIYKLDYLDFGNGKIGFSKWMSSSLAIHRLLPHFQRARGAAIVSKEEEYPLGDGDVKEYLSSIFLRSQNLIITRDMLELLKFNSFDRFNKKQDRYSYYLN